ncbi:MAG TPA: tautomerase family protein [Methylovirgula sp.]|nr:tautomerase family protein [Methylovirgula sp.]
MPLLRIDTIAGRSPNEIKKLGDAVHRAVLAALGVPARDRYQIITEHQRSHLIAEDTGLDIPRTDKFVLIQITTRPRTRAEKEKLYELLCRELQDSCGIAPSDVMVSIVQNTDEDWSFGHGRAQFLTGEL